MRLRLALLLLSAAAAAPAVAQIAADRPGFTTGTGTVPRGHFQVEIGLPEATYSPESVGASDVLLATVPVQARVGLGARVEAQITVVPVTYTRVTVLGETSSDVDWSVDGVNLGAKIRLLDGPVAVAVVPSVGFAGGLSPSFGLLAAADGDLGAGFEASGTAGYTYQDDLGGTGLLAASVGRDLVERVNAYVEAAVFPSDGAWDNAWVGTGVAVLPSSRVQLDASVQRSLSDNAWGFGAGVSVLF